MRRLMGQCGHFGISIAVFKLKEALNKWIPFVPFDKLRRAFDSSPRTESIPYRSS
jgi:hypothetical protein